MPKKGLLIGGIALVAGFGLIMLGSTTGEMPTWKNTDVGCLNGGHTNAVRHFHPTLSISVDGTPELIPANVGVSSACMAEVHTHDASGKLHVETLEQDTTVMLSDFLSVWGRSLERDGHTLTMQVNGEPHSAEEPLELQPGQNIELMYRSAGTSTATSSAQR